MKKLSKILLILLLFNLIFIVKVFAKDDQSLSVKEVTEKAESVSSNEYEYVSLENVTQVNPLYKDIISENDLEKPSDVMLFSTGKDCRTVAEMGTELRNNLKQRVATMQITYITNTKISDTSIYTNIVNEAMKHTGKPTEGDYLNWQYAGWSAGLEGYRYGTTYYYTFTYTFTYYTTAEQEKKMDTAVANLLNTLDLSGTDYEKITQIYDYICKNIKYDYTSEGMLKHTAYAALINKKAVCQGYAVLFYRLALECGIDNRLIAGTGNGGAHGWNIVKINGYYYNVDSTWDSSYVTFGFYPYYMKTNENFTGHVRAAEYNTNEFNKKYPMGSEDYTAQRNEDDKNITGVIKINNIWTMFVKGKPDYTYTGIGTNDKGSWYVQNGIVDFKYTGTYFEGDKAYIIENSKVYETVTSNTTEVMKINNVWRMVINGKIDYKYTGIGTNSKGTWLVKNGAVDFGYTGNYSTNGKIYVISNSKVRENLTEVTKINNIWYMVIKGEVDYSYTGIGTNSKGTWYVQNGIVDFKYTGTYFEGDKAYIIENSKVYETVTSNTTEVMKINNVWRMVINGKIDYKYTGIGTNNKGTWLVRNGVVDFGYTGNYSTNGKIYVISNSKVREDLTEVTKINNIWYMVVKGEVDYSYIGIGTNDKGTWYVQDGIVDFKYTGTYFEGDKAYIIENSKVYETVTSNTTEVMKINNVWRMVINGKVDYNYHGLGSNKNGMWILEDGRVTFNFNGNYISNDGRAYQIENSKVIKDNSKVIK